MWERVKSGSDDIFAVSIVLSAAWAKTRRSTDEVSGSSPLHAKDQADCFEFPASPTACAEFGGRSSATDVSRLQLVFAETPSGLGQPFVRSPRGGIIRAVKGLLRDGDETAGSPPEQCPTKGHKG